MDYEEMRSYSQRYGYANRRPKLYMHYDGTTPDIVEHPSEFTESDNPFASQLLRTPEHLVTNFRHEFTRGFKDFLLEEDKENQEMDCPGFPIGDNFEWAVEIPHPKNIPKCSHVPKKVKDPPAAHPSTLSPPDWLEPPKSPHWSELCTLPWYELPPTYTFPSELLVASKPTPETQTQSCSNTKANQRPLPAKPTSIPASNAPRLQGITPNEENNCSSQFVPRPKLVTWFTSSLTPTKVDQVPSDYRRIQKIMEAEKEPFKNPEICPLPLLDTPYSTVISTDTRPATGPTIKRLMDLELEKPSTPLLWSRAEEVKPSGPPIPLPPLMSLPMLPNPRFGLIVGEHKIETRVISMEFPWVEEDLARKTNDSIPPLKEEDMLEWKMWAPPLQREYSTPEWLLPPPIMPPSKPRMAFTNAMFPKLESVKSPKPSPVWTVKEQAEVVKTCSPIVIPALPLQPLMSIVLAPSELPKNEKTAQPTPALKPNPIQKKESERELDCGNAEIPTPLAVKPLMQSLGIKSEVPTKSDVETIPPSPKSIPLPIMKETKEKVDSKPSCASPSPSTTLSPAKTSSDLEIGPTKSESVVKNMEAVKPTTPLKANTESPAPEVHPPKEKLTKADTKLEPNPNRFVCTKKGKANKFGPQTPVKKPVVEEEEAKDEDPDQEREPPSSKPSKQEIPKQEKPQVKYKVGKFGKKVEVVVKKKGSCADDLGSGDQLNNRKQGKQKERKVRDKVPPPEPEPGPSGTNTKGKNDTKQKLRKEESCGKQGQTPESWSSVQQNKTPEAKGTTKDNVQPSSKLASVKPEPKKPEPKTPEQTKPPVPARTSESSERRKPNTTVPIVKDKENPSVITEVLTFLKDSVEGNPNASKSPGSQQFEAIKASLKPSLDSLRTIIGRSKDPVLLTNIITNFIRNESGANATPEASTLKTPEPVPDSSSPVRSRSQGKKSALLDGAEEKATPSTSNGVKEEDAVSATSAATPQPGDLDSGQKKQVGVWKKGGKAKLAKGKRTEKNKKKKARREMAAARPPAEKKPTEAEGKEGDSETSSEDSLDEEMAKAGCGGCQIGCQPGCPDYQAGYQAGRQAALQVNVTVQDNQTATAQLSNTSAKKLLQMMEPSQKTDIKNISCNISCAGFKLVHSSTVRQTPKATKEADGDQCTASCPCYRSYSAIPEDFVPSNQVLKKLLNTCNSETLPYTAGWEQDKFQLLERKEFKMKVVEFNKRRRVEELTSGYKEFVAKKREASKTVSGGGVSKSGQTLIFACGEGLVAQVFASSDPEDMAPTKRSKPSLPSDSCKGCKGSPKAVKVKFGSDPPAPWTPPSIPDPASPAGKGKKSKNDKVILKAVRTKGLVKGGGSQASPALPPIPEDVPLLSTAPPNTPERDVGIQASPSVNVSVPIANRSASDGDILTGGRIESTTNKTGSSDGTGSVSEDSSSPAGKSCFKADCKNNSSTSKPSYFREAVNLISSKLSKSTTSIPTLTLDMDGKVVSPRKKSKKKNKGSKKDTDTDGSDSSKKSILEILFGRRSSKHKEKKDKDKEGSTGDDKDSK